MMPSSPHKPKRWRPRFSLRTLVVLITLVCCYAACWGPTKRQGVDDVKTYLIFGNIGANQTMNEKMFVVESVLPLVLALAEFENIPGERRQYYFWFFGYVAKLPFEREIAP